jgi:transposase
MHKSELASASLRRSPLPPPRMQTYTPQHKHTILSHYRAGVRGAGFAALARRFAVQGGASAIQRWHQRWDGTPQSLQHKKGAGRPRVLSRREVQQHVRAPILRANNAHKAVHYPGLLQSVRTKTGKQIALRTLQNYGKRELRAKHRRGKKRTADESK